MSNSNELAKIRGVTCGSLVLGTLDQDYSQCWLPLALDEC